LDISGERTLSADRQRVWDALHDPDVLKAAIPGCEQLEPAGDDSYELTVNVGISAIKGRYSGRITLSESNPLDSYRLVARGSGMAGSAEGDAVISLSEDGEGTLLRYEASVKASGAMARLGTRLISGAARMMADRFFAAFEEELNKQAS
jgi:uncharacterized protein